MKNGCIYKITNNIDNKIYIGMTTKPLRTRWWYHKNECAKYQRGEVKYKSLLYDAMSKYGIDNFKIEEIEQCTNDDLTEREEYWINYYNSRDPKVGYNICKGGEAGPGGAFFTGHHHSDETRAKMSANRSGELNANYGNRWHHTADMKYSDLHGENNPMYGRKHSEQSKQSNAEKHRGKIAISDPERDVVLMIDQDELDDYLALGNWIKGNIHCKK